MLGSCISPTLDRSKCVKRRKCLQVYPFLKKQKKKNLVIFNSIFLSIIAAYCLFAWQLVPQAPNSPSGELPT